MPDPHWLLLCENYRREAETVLASGDFPDLSLATYQAYCGQPPLAYADLEAALQRAGYAGGDVHLLGGSCMGRLGEPPASMPRLLRRGAEHCWSLLAGRTLVEHLLAQRGYLLGPGWLQHWRRHLERWGFDSPGARQFFAESAARLVLLDTGVHPGSAEQLREFAAHVGLPAETLPVGLDHFRLLVEQIASGPRLARARSEHSADLARSTQQQADALMTLDLIGGLAVAGSGEEVTRMILDLFESLFAPRALLLAPVAAGNLAGHVSRPAGTPADRTALGAFLESGADHAVAADGAGFTLRLAHAGETLGVLAVEGLRFPGQLQRYLPSALIVARVCGLALFNARTYGMLADTVRELQGALERVGVLRGMIPICSYCKNIRNDEGFWQTVEAYVHDHTDATFSHGMCPECTEKHWKPQLEQLRDTPPAEPGRPPVR